MEGSSIIVTAINSALASVTSDAGIVIGSAIGLGATFWGARTLWKNFKGMAK